MTDDPYGAHSARPTATQVAARRAALSALVEAQQPMNVRHAFYLATVDGLVKKTDSGTGNGYSRIQWDLTVMRKNGEIPYDYIEDGTRSVVQAKTWPDIATALRVTAEKYRRSLWEDEDCRVQVWCEKDGLTNVLWPVTGERDVTLWPARGYSSLTFLNDAASRINDDGVPVYIYHIGDFDPSGVDAGRAIERTLREFAYEEIHFKRLAVTPEQIRDWNLPSRPTKMSDSRAARFGGQRSVELEAIEPNRLRDLVRRAIQRHMPASRYKQLRDEEAAERARLIKMVEDLE